MAQGSLEIGDDALGYRLESLMNDREMWMDERNWLSEGFVLDDAGNLIGTSYVDLRDSASRRPVSHLIKAGRRVHALEDSETVQISPVACFREAGENLIRDAQEGLASEETRTVKPLTAEQQFEDRRLSDLSEANELLGSSVRLRVSASHENVEKSSGNIAYGREWWIYSTAIAPESEEQWAAFRQTLDPAYDHESVIGQPAKFAEALGRMVAEQLGPQGKDGWLRTSLDGAEGRKILRPTQWVLHGPMVYSDRVYESLARESDEAARIAAMLFTKSGTHAAMREYRFAILRDGAVDGRVLLKISGMMRDALPRTHHGLVRPLPELCETGGGTDTTSSEHPAASGTPRRESTRKTVVRRETARSRLVGPDGKVLGSSESEREESVEEKTERRVGVDEEAADRPAEQNAVAAGGEAPTAGGEQVAAGDARPAGTERQDEESAKELAFGAGIDAGGVGADEAPATEGYAKGVLKSLEESLARMIDDPAAPLGPVSETWAESALSAEDIRAIHGFGAAPTLKGDAGANRESTRRVERLLACDAVHSQPCSPGRADREGRVRRAGPVRRDRAGRFPRCGSEREDRGGAERRVRLLVERTNRRAMGARNVGIRDGLVPDGQ